MILKVLDEDNFIIFIIEEDMIPKLEEKAISDYLKNVFIRLKDTYNTSIYGYYDVAILCDKYYGMIIKLTRRELEYLNYYGNQIEMKIIISDNQVLYQIEDIYNIDKRIINNCNIYLDDDQIYIELKEKLGFILMGDLVENSTLIYEESDEIKRRSEKIEIG